MIYVGGRKSDSLQNHDHRHEAGLGDAGGPDGGCGGGDADCRDVAGWQLVASYL